MFKVGDIVIERVGFDTNAPTLETRIVSETDLTVTTRTRRTFDRHTGNPLGHDKAPGFIRHKRLAKQHTRLGPIVLVMDGNELSEHHEEAEAFVIAKGIADLNQKPVDVVLPVHRVFPTVKNPLTVDLSDVSPAESE